MSSIFKFVINFFTINADFFFAVGNCYNLEKYYETIFVSFTLSKNIFTKASPQTTILLSNSQCYSCRRVIFKLKMTHTLALLPDNMLQCPFLEQTREAKIWYVPVLLLGEGQVPHTSTHVEL